MKTCRWIALLGMSGLLISCAQTIGLKQQQEFTPEVHKEMRATDACKLGPYFAAHPKVRTQATERTVGHTSNWLEFGEVTAKVESGPQLKQLRTLLARLYRGIPGPVLRSPLTLRLDFIRRIGEPRGKARKAPQPPKGLLVVRPDYEIRVVARGKTYRMAYHPCVGELLFPSPKQGERTKLSDKLHEAL